MITVGCVAHGLSLFFKDVADARKCPWISKLVTAALLLSNTVGSSERIRAALHREQTRITGGVKGITVHAPTRFAVQLFIVSDLLDSKDSLLALCHSEHWEEASSGSSNADSFRDAVLMNRPYSQLWFNFLLYVELMQPFSDAIHQLEADKPMLSQVRYFRGSWYHS